jgi:hypothetical protein
MSCCSSRLYLRTGGQLVFRLALAVMSSWTADAHAIASAQPARIRRTRGRDRPRLTVRREGRWCRARGLIRARSVPGPCPVRAWSVLGRCLVRAPGPAGPLRPARCPRACRAWPGSASPHGAWPVPGGGGCPAGPRPAGARRVAGGGFAGIPVSPGYCCAGRAGAAGSCGGPGMAAAGRLFPWYPDSGSFPAFTWCRRHDSGRGLITCHYGCVMRESGGGIDCRNALSLACPAPLPPVPGRRPDPPAGNRHARRAAAVAGPGRARVPGPEPAGALLMIPGHACAVSTADSWLFRVPGGAGRGRCPGCRPAGRCPTGRGWCPGCR